MKELRFRQPIFSGEDRKFVGFHYWGVINDRFVGPREWNWEQPPHGSNDINIAQYPEKSQLFTGLLDKNKKEIWEGDIVIFEDTYTEPILDDGSGPTEPCNHFSEVIFKNGAFGVDVKDSADCFSAKFYSFDGVDYEIGETEYEVIANIHENPEDLLR